MQNNLSLSSKLGDHEMKLLIFGATGATGKLVVEQALAAGNEVRAYVRNPSRFNINTEHLEIVQGELSDQEAIVQAMSGTDVVISTLGPRARQKGMPLAGGMQNILAAMQSQGVRRHIITSTLSARDPNDALNTKAKAMIAMVKVLMRSAYDDIVRVAELVRASDCDWTIIRLSILNNKPMTGNVRVGYISKGEVGTAMSRADLADFILKQTSDTQYLRKAPAISN
jgi:putative NADH-flavin reductase